MKTHYSKPEWKCLLAVTFRHLPQLCLGVFMLSPLCLHAQAPGWWIERGAVNASAQANDFAAVNQGQLKNMAKAAAAELDAHLPGGAGYGAHDLLGVWSAPASATDDFLAVNLGQLKNVAKPFYDRLISAGYASAYPWANPAQLPDDYALANIGQVKNLFRFDIRVNPADANGLPGWWQHSNFGSSGIDSGTDSDGDGLTNLQEYQQGTDPHKKDNPALGLQVNVIVR